ncbi:MAG: glycosyltransferase family 2 protein [Bauldia sp.]|nr:glycosyltransferase family 2 protein [Bauldia sp.]
MIIPAHGRADTVGVAARSALQQTVSEIEVVVVDDGSMPALDLRAITDIRLNVVRHHRNKGAAAARNTGVAHARGRFIAFLDSDDAWLPEKLARQLPLAADGRTVVACGWRYVREGVPDARALVPRPAADPETFAAGCWFSPGSTALIPRSVIERVGPQDEQLSTLEDYDWYLRFGAGGGRLAVVEEELVRIAWRGRADTVRTAAAVAALRGKYPPGDPVLAGNRRRFEAYLDLVDASSQWYARHRAAALGRLWRSWRARPRVTLQLARWWRRA